MRSKFAYYFVPIYISLYFIISILPRWDVFQGRNEFFPIFCFDLYSLVPNQMTHYDILFNMGTDSEYYLYYGNHNLNKLESKYYRKWVMINGRKFESSGDIEVSIIKKILAQENSAHLIKITGTYRNLFNGSGNKMEILKKIK